MINSDGINKRPVATIITPNKATNKGSAALGVAFSFSVLPRSLYNEI